MKEIERIINNYFSGLREHNLPLPEKGTELAKSIEQYIIKARKEVEGLVIKKFIMTLPMDIRRLIMTYHSTELKKGLQGE